MTKFEYIEDQYWTGRPGFPATEIDYLNARGAEGWQLVFKTHGGYVYQFMRAVEAQES